MPQNKAPAISPVQEQNLEYFRQNLKAWLQDPVYKHKHLVVHDQKIHGSYDQAGTAFEYAVANLPQGEFIIQQVIDENEVASFLSRAV